MSRNQRIICPFYLNLAEEKGSRQHFNDLILPQMEIFIRPNALSTLALFMMSGAPLLYLLNIRNKSRDGWLVLGLYAVLTLYFFSSFIRDITLGSPNQNHQNFITLGIHIQNFINRWPTFNLSLVSVYLGWFSYAYRQVKFRREMYFVLILESLILALAFVFPSSPPLVFPVGGIFGCFWSITVLLRKSLLSNNSFLSANKNAGHKRTVRWLSHVLRPDNQESRAHLAFAAWYFYFFLLSINFNLMLYGFLSFQSIWAINFNMLFLTLVTWLVINYLNYSHEPTTFLAKLVGLFLCSTLIILGLLGYLLFPLNADYRLIQREMKVIALMIVGSTVLIVTIFPLLFRNNLLRPLQKVVEGIKQVNAGNLQVAVPVQVPDEIGYLANSFNQMIESLRRYSQEMEGLVSQRTAELQHQKEELLATLEQLRAAQTQLKQLDVQKTRFFDNITHEFRTPLTLILAPAEHLLSSLETASPHYSYLQSIERNAQQLLRLINQLLDLSRLESDTLPLKESSGNILQFTGLLVEAFRPAAEQKRINLVYQPYSSEQENLFDAEKWEKIVTNLLANALKFTPPGGSIKVTCHHTSPENLLLQVSDTGIGISPEKLPHIFDRFYQADNSRTRAYEGSGIGLALVQELVQLLAGTVEVKSEENKGTIFKVHLPLKLAKNKEKHSTASPSIAEFTLPDISISENRNESKLLLLVEDNPEMLAFISQTLSAQYRVLTAANGLEGLEIARRELPEIVISDVMMPQMDGYAFCQALKTDPQTNHIAVLLLTAKTTQDSRIEGLSLGADDYITKPFHLEELQLRLRNLLDRQEKLREFYRQQWSATETVLPLPGGVKDAFVDKIYAIIETHLDDSNLDPEALASGVAMSVRTLNRKLHTLMGMSAAKLIRVYRLKRAAQLLQLGQAVSDTAYQVGFDNPSYFTTAFKEYYQKTPSEFVIF